MSSAIAFTSNMTVTSATARVGGVDSEHSNYPFSNAWNYPYVSWKFWRSGYSSNHEHTLTINYSGASSYLALFGANFSEVEIDSTAYYLTRTIDKKYRTFISEGAFNSLVITIPAQTTESGKFELGSILILATASVINFIDTFHHEINKSILYTIASTKLLSEAVRKGNSIRKTLGSNYMRKKVSNANISAPIYELLDSGHSTPFVFLDNYTDADDIGNLFLYRVANDFEYTEEENDNFSDRYYLEELY